MKKYVAGLLTGILLMVCFTAYAASDIRLVVNGQDVTAEAQPVIVDGRTLVPARAVAERLGATVVWDAKENAVVITSVKSEAAPQPVGQGELPVDMAEWVDYRDVKTAYNLAMLPITERKDGLDYVVALDVSIADIWTTHPPIFRVSIADGTMYSDLSKGGVYVKRAFVEEQLKKAGVI